MEISKEVQTEVQIDEVKQFEEYKEQLQKIVGDVLRQKQEAERQVQNADAILDLIVEARIALSSLDSGDPIEIQASKEFITSLVASLTNAELVNKKVEPTQQKTRDEDVLIETTCCGAKLQIDVIENQIKHQVRFGKAPKDAKRLKKYVVKTIQKKLSGIIK